MRGILIGAELAADVHHAGVGAARLSVVWQESPDEQGTLSLVLDQPWPHGGDQVEELTGVTLTVLATRWAYTVADGRRRIIADLAKQ